jgi:hypothetical protein
MPGEEKPEMMIRMLKCNEVSRMVASDEISRAGLVRRVELRLHLLMCRHCRNYVRQLALMGAAARKLLAGEPGEAEVLARIERRLIDAARKRKSSPDAGSEPPAPHHL